VVGGGNTNGIGTSLIGFGDGYDQQLLATLADAGRGNDYWCAGPDQATAVFAAEFSGLASVIAQNVSVEIVPTGAVAAFDVLNDFATNPGPAGGGVEVSLGDAYGDEVRRIAVRFNLRPQSHIGAVEVAELTLRWASTTGDVALHTVRVPVVVRRGETHEVDTSADETVTAEVTMLLAERNREQARLLADRGDYLRASQLMTTGAQLLASVMSDDPVGLEMLADAEALAHGAWSDAASKKHFSQRRSTQSGRNRRFDS
jgi:Ca-activated chloride channel homolog